MSNKNLDRIILSSDYTQRIWEFDEFLGIPRLYFELGPYSKVSYQTEFVASNEFSGFYGKFVVDTFEFFVNLFFDMLVFFHYDREIANPSIDIHADESRVKQWSQETREM